jgi:hypothetical protein
MENTNNKKRSTVRTTVQVFYEFDKNSKSGQKLHQIKAQRTPYHKMLKYGKQFILLFAYLTIIIL